MANLLQRVALVREQVSPAVGHTDSLFKNILSLIDGVVGDVGKLQVKVDGMDPQSRSDMARRLDALEAKSRADDVRIGSVEKGVDDLAKALAELNKRSEDARAAAEREAADIRAALRDESASNRKAIETLASRLALLEERVLALENAGGGGGVDGSALEALQRDLDTHRAATRQGMADAKAADDALRRDIETLAARCAEAEAVAELQAEVDAHAATLAALRGLIDDMSGIRRESNAGAGESGIPHAAIADILAQLNSLRKEKANIGWAKGAIARLQKEKADRKELRALASDDGNTTAGAYRCLSCNRNSSGLYKTYPEVNITSNATPPPIPWVGPRGQSPPPTSGPSQSNFPRRGTRTPTAGPASPSASTTPGKIRPSTAGPPGGRSSSVGSSRTFVAPADASAKDRYYAYQQWVESLPSQGAPAGQEPVPATMAGAGGVSDGAGAHSPSMASSAGRGVPSYMADDSGNQPHPNHLARNAIHVGSDGRSYPNVESPELAASRGRHVEVPAEPRYPVPSNDMLEARGELAAGVTAGGARMAVGRR